MSCRVNQQKSDSVICTECFQISVRGGQAMATKPMNTPLCRFCGMVNAHAADCSAIEHGHCATWDDVAEAPMMRETRPYRLPLAACPTVITKKRALFPRIAIERMHAFSRSKSAARMMMAIMMAIAFALGSATAKASASRIENNAKRESSCKAH